MPVGDLSGGEQARILIARLMLQPADLLILDEPTNDLDIPSLEVLEESLVDFPGGWCWSPTTATCSTASPPSCSRSTAGAAQLLRGLRAVGAGAGRGAREAAAAARARPARAQADAAPAKKRLTYMELRELEGMEAKILAPRRSCTRCQARMNDPATLADRHLLTEVCTRVDAAQQNVHACISAGRSWKARK